MAAYRQITSSPEKLLFSEVTDEGLSAPKQRWLPRSVHCGIQQITIYPNYQKSKHSEGYY